MHERVGKGMNPFRLIKFRSMTWEKDASKGRFEPGENCRVTKFGKLMRDTKIDELPELLNVIKGDMSLVGPRPEVARYVSIYSEEFEKILQIRPGLSDFASIKYRDEEQILAKEKYPEKFYQNVILPDKLESAKRYLSAISFKTDLSIMANTLKHIFRV